VSKEALTRQGIKVVAHLSYTRIVNIAQLSNKEVSMSSRVFVRARIDENLRDEAAAVLADFGLTISDLIRMSLTRVAKDHAIPLELKVPNAEIRAAMKESRALMQKHNKRFSHAQAIFDDLDKKTRKR
jgi:DNA-damage-inducible protein J